MFILCPDYMLPFFKGWNQLYHHRSIDPDMNRFGYRSLSNWSNLRSLTAFPLFTQYDLMVKQARGLPGRLLVSFYLKQCYSPCRVVLRAERVDSSSGALNKRKFSVRGVFERSGGW